MRDYFIYILTNLNRTVLYIGVTNNLKRRLYEHKNKLIPGFSSKYLCSRLVEWCSNINEAIRREKQLKWWTRKKKESLIEETNPYWKDLSYEEEK